MASSALGQLKFCCANAEKWRRYRCAFFFGPAPVRRPDRFIQLVAFTGWKHCMQIRSAREADVPKITEILNHEIANAAAIWVETPVDETNRREWLAERQARSCPVLIAEDNNEVLGFGSYGPFRPYEGFRNTVEHSIYVSPAARGKGVGRMLLTALIEDARQQGMKVIVGAVDFENEPSLRLHHALGFIETGRMMRIGEKWGQRRHMVLLQKELAARDEEAN